jgi:hypothetical protein
LLRGERDLVNHCGIVAELHIELAASRMRDGEGESGEAIRHLDRMFELRVTGDGVHQEEVCSTQLAGLIGGGGAFELLQHRQAYERG